MKVKEESEKVGLKLNIQKTKIMASGSITSIQTETDFIFGGSPPPQEVDPNPASLVSGFCFGLTKGQESRLPGEISITSGMQMTPPLWQKVKKN